MRDYTNLNTREFKKEENKCLYFTVSGMVQYLTSHLGSVGDDIRGQARGFTVMEQHLRWQEGFP